MTARLIGFMAVLLFLSLAAFGLIMYQSKDAVLDEVRHTISVGVRKTLEAFSGDLIASNDACVDLDWTKTFDERVGPPAPLSAADHALLRERLEEMKKDLPKEGRGMFVVMRADRASEYETIVSDRVRVVPASAAPDGVASQPASAPASQPALVDTAILVASNSLRVDDKSERAMSVNIPVFRAGAESIPPGEMRFAFEAPGSKDGPGSARGVVEELRFEVPTTEYQKLFDAIARRALFVFLGVFVVGTVLSAGIARRFTRPIRRLDSGLRQLSEGERDVRVAVTGDDEVARLSRAFNDMVARLEAARAREAELTRKDKLSALGRLAAGVAHDVRNPLHSINLTLQHIEETGRPDAPAASREFARGVELIRSEIHRLDQLVANFLRFARSERGELSEVDPRALLDETVALVKKEAERRGIEVSVDVDAGVPRARGNSDSLRSALLNLVLNGFEAMEGTGGGRVVELAARAGQPGRVELSVADTGRGIAPEDKERVFEFGFTTRDGGHGLGLAMVHHVVVEEHGGRIELDSEVGRGTTVRLELPEATA